jgi:hypothetical protein
MKALHAIVLSAALALCGAAVADDTVKSGGREDKPGRAIDDNSVRAKGGDTERQGRTVEEGNTVKSGGREDKPGRAVTN